MTRTPFALIIVGLGLLSRSIHSSFWRSQRGDENISISLQYIINKRHGKESVQVSVVFDRSRSLLATSDTLPRPTLSSSSRPTLSLSSRPTLSLSSRPTLPLSSRPTLSLSSTTNTLIHATLGPDELLLMIEGPSLQAAIATVGMNTSHQTGTMTIPIAGD